ncbi:MAG: DUF1294 domain-containing protein [Streptococcaceae bacterium]|jgi:uncharacterized membrane protein YsdA (DUF1294 family)|nr:DUF1294 domain-containing protein [Streptococcaceae bacterium]
MREFQVWCLLALLIWQVVVFVSYTVDKQRAVHGLWRISERALLLEAVIAGGLGAILAGKICHHKTRKWYFWLAWIFGLLVLLLALIGVYKL